MKRFIISAGICLSALLSVSISASAQTHIHSIGELNKGEAVLNSHAGKTGRSSLEMDYRTIITMDESMLGQQMLDYGRVKKLQDGSYIFFYQPLKHGYHIYCSHSDDGIHWTKGERVFVGHEFINGDGEKDHWQYATADAVQLANGEILVFCIFHSRLHYARHLNEFGLSMKRSCDGGYTWGEEKVLHRTVDWEPYPMVLPDGEILVFFTDSNHDWKPNSSGCSILRSSDNGYTWTLQEQAVRLFRCVSSPRQLSVGTPRIPADSTRKVWTNQMPVVIRLNNSDIALGAYESQDVDDRLSISLTWENCKWPVTLTGEMTGPKDRVDARIRGGAPYLVQMPSGEVVLSYGYGTYAVRLGNETGRNLPDAEEILPFGEKAMRWGALEVKDPHTVFTFATHLYNLKNLGISHILMGQMRLNHAVEVPQRTVAVDGKNGEWEETDDALFIGSESQAQCSFRFAHDKDKLYVLAECLDQSSFDNGDGLTLMFGNGKDKKGTLYCLADIEGRKVKVEKSPCMKAASYVSLGEGYMLEIAIDKSELPISADGKLYFNAVLIKGGVSDCFTTVSSYKPETWLEIELK